MVNRSLPSKRMSAPAPRKRGATLRAARRLRTVPPPDSNSSWLRLATDERRTQLLDLGRELFNTRPFDDISIDEIAAAAGISKGLLYHYFPSKRHFYVETVREAA